MSHFEYMHVIEFYTCFCYCPAAK